MALKLIGSLSSNDYVPEHCCQLDEVPLPDDVAFCEECGTVYVGSTSPDHEFYWRRSLWPSRAVRRAKKNPYAP